MLNVVVYSQRSEYPVRVQNTVMETKDLDLIDSCPSGQMAAQRDLYVVMKFPPMSMPSDLASYAC